MLFLIINYLDSTAFAALPDFLTKKIDNNNAIAYRTIVAYSTY